jgi:hypothetical protein
LGLYSVKAFGAVGDGVTDDTAAINAAAAACLAAHGELYFPALDYDNDKYYVCNGQVDLRGIHYITMKGIIHTHYDGNAVLVGGNGTTLGKAVLELAIERYPEDWTGTSSIYLTNLYNCEATIRLASGSQYGVVLMGENGSACGYNNFYINGIVKNETGILITSVGTGWNNESNWFGGNIAGTTAGAICGVHLTHNANHHHFWKPSFELATATTNGAWFEGAYECYIHWARCESSTCLQVAKFESDGTYLSYNNIFEIGSMSYGLPTFSETEACYGNIVSNPQYALAPLMSIMNNTSFEYAYDDGASFHIPGFGIYTSATDIISRKISSDAMYQRFANNTGLYWNTWGYIVGVMIDTTTYKQFYVKQKDINSASVPGWNVHCFDAAGALLSGAAPYYTMGKSVAVRANGYDISNDTNVISFHADVKSAFIGIEGGTTQSRGFDILVPPIQFLPGTWTGYTGPLETPGHYFASQAPTKAVFWQGDVVWNDAAAAGGSPGWSCVFGFRTALNGGEPMGEVNMVVDSIAGVATGDIIGVALDTGLWHWTTVNGAPVGVTIVLTAALPSAAANNNIVHVMRWKAMANVAA